MFLINLHSTNIKKSRVFFQFVRQVCVLSLLLTDRNCYFFQVCVLSLLSMAKKTPERFCFVSVILALSNLLKPALVSLSHRKNNSICTAFNCNCLPLTFHRRLFALPGKCICEYGVPLETELMGRPQRQLACSKCSGCYCT